MRIRGVIAILAVGLVQSAIAAELTQHQIDAIKEAEIHGQALYAAVSAGEPADTEAVTTARRLVDDFCELSYRPVVVTEHDVQVVYFLAESTNEGDIVFGRHYRVQGKVVTPSTRGCFVMSPPQGTVGAYVTHLISETPTQFHVYVSLAKGMPVYVQTSLGTWLVEKGTVRQVV